MSKSYRPFLTDQKEVVESIVEDLRREAEVWNAQLALAKTHDKDPHVGQRARTVYETLRRLANRYESCISEKKDSV